jgi:hypothetical protein
VRTLLAALLIALALPAAAHAQPYLEAGDAAELAQELADATDEQGICYGWSVQVDDGSGGPSGTDVGSNFGPGRDVRSGDCPKGVVELQAGVTYTCGSCESEDSSDFTVAGNVPRGPTKKDLEDLDFSGGQLKDDKGDAALASMVGALPLIVASKGLAPAITADTAADPAKPAADHATGSPAIPDWLRENWLALAAFLVLLGGGGVWLASAITTDRQRRRRISHAPKLVPAEPDPPQEP